VVASAGAVQGEGNKFTIDGSKLTDEELETLEKLLTKAQHTQAEW
jgi:hypothetical protein